MKMKADFNEVKLFFRNEANFCLNVFVTRFNNFTQEHPEFLSEFFLKQGKRKKILSSLFTFKLIKMLRKMFFEASRGFVVFTYTTTYPRR